MVVPSFFRIFALKISIIMNKRTILTLSAAFTLAVTNAVANENEPMLINEVANTNPFFAEYNTPFGVPPFDKIKNEHYMPAFLKGMEEQLQEIRAIVVNRAVPTFENTIAALDRSGQLLNKVSYVFYGQTNAHSNDELNKVSREVSPLLSKHGDLISMNEELFKRVKYVYDNQAKENLTKEQKKLLDETYKDFVRGGALLSEADKKKLSELNGEIAMLQVKFGQNLLAETNNYQLVIDDKAKLAGLPDALIQNAAKVATERGQAGKWVFTLHTPSIMPFLQYSDVRELREEIFNAYINRGTNGGENDNNEVVEQLVKARLEKAKLMGYEDYASLVLETRMAKTSEAVYDLLDQVWKPALKAAKNEYADIQAEVKKDGKKFKAEGWDWRYYAERAKKAKFGYDEELIRPYLALGNVRDGMFLLANKLYGITFTKLENIPTPHPDAEAFECKDIDGTHLGVLYLDYHPRASKRGGAWCGQYRGQSYKNGEKVAPIVTVVCNFTPPSAGAPSLLTVDEAQTLFHEFGHALHNLFRDVHYSGVSSVARDFVELPSQVMEHWVFEPALLKEYARHYKTGELMPQELIDKLEACGKYGQGFATTEFLAAALLDMDYHVQKKYAKNFNVSKFEKKTLKKRGLLSAIPPRYRTTYFSHTMGGGYTAGYYSYLWAEVLDADAYNAFEESGDIFNKSIAEKFRRYILQPGSIDDEMQMYINFRGQKPNPDALLRNRGLK